MLGADIGTSLMTVVFSFDLSWLSPLLIFLGVVLFISRQQTPTSGRIGRVLIGLGLMLLALRLVTGSTAVLTQSPAVQGPAGVHQQRPAAGDHGRRRAGGGRLFQPGGRAADATLAASGGVRRTWRWAWCWAPTWAAACWRC
jgi:hypothetical protein